MSFFSRSSLLLAGTYLLISLLCTQVPLLNYLGYEFSALFGLVGCLASAMVTIQIVRPIYRESSSAEDAVGNVFAGFKQALLVNVLALVIPLLLILANALFVKNCSIWQGVAFFLLIPVISVGFGSSLGLFCAVHYRHSRIAASVYCAVFLLYSIGEGYFTPAIFSYNFLYGYFPGLTYDEALSLSWTLVIFRGLTVVAGSMFVWFTLLLLRNTLPTNSVWLKGLILLKTLYAQGRWPVTGTLIFGLGLVWIYRGSLGLESTSGFIQSGLGSRYETDHFTIYYSRNSYDDNEIKWVGLEHEFRLQQVCDAFFIQYHGRIESYIYPSSEVKQRYIGTGTTNIAKPWSGQVHITRQSLDATLKHELVHVVAARFGLPVIRASLSTALVEGLAMAVEWDWGNRTLHQYAAAMRAFGVLPDIEPLMQFAGFASQASSISYVVCGSFCRFLINRYGMRKMTQVYKTGDYRTTYGRSLHQLIDEWHGFLNRVVVTDRDRDAIDVIFRRPPIFRKVCARVIAERNLEATKAFEEKRFDEAESLYKESYLEGKGYEAFSGYLVSALRRGNPGVLTSALDTIIMKDHTPTQYLPLFITIGDAFWTFGNRLKANDLYMRVKSADLSLGLNESASVRSFAVRDTADGDFLRTYFLSDKDDSSRLDMLNGATPQQRDRWLVKYLKGRVLMRAKRYAESLEVLTSFNVTTMDSLLEAVRLRMVGYDLFRARRFNEARVSFWNSLNFLSTEVARNAMDEWVDRCEWMEEYNHQ